MKKMNTIKKSKHQTIMSTEEKSISILKMTKMMDKKIKNSKEESKQGKKETRRKIKRGFHG